MEGTDKLGLAAASGRALQQTQQLYSSVFFGLTVSSAELLPLSQASMVTAAVSRVLGPGEGSRCLTGCATMCSALAELSTASAAGVTVLVKDSYLEDGVPAFPIQVGPSSTLHYGCRADICCSTSLLMAAHCRSCFARAAPLLQPALSGCSGVCWQSLAYTWAAQVVYSCGHKLRCVWSCRGGLSPMFPKEVFGETHLEFVSATYFLVRLDRAQV